MENDSKRAAGGRSERMLRRYSLVVCIQTKWYEFGSHDSNPLRSGSQSGAYRSNADRQRMLRISRMLAEGKGRTIEQCDL